MVSTCRAGQIVLDIASNVENRSFFGNAD